MCKRVNLFRKELEDIMKNLTKLLVLAMVAGLTACASDEEQTGRNYRYVGNNHDCGEALVQDKPEPAPVRRSPVQPAATPCCSPARPARGGPRHPSSEGSRQLFAACPWTSFRGCLRQLYHTPACHCRMHVR